MKKTTCLILALILTLGGISIFAGCNSVNRNNIEQLTAEEQAMQNSWNAVIEDINEGGYGLYALESFSKNYGNKDGFEKFILRSFEELSEEQLLKVMTVAAALDDENFNRQEILDCVYERLDFSKKTFEEKLNYLYYLKEEYVFTEKVAKYFKFKISNQELDEWAIANNEEKLCFEPGTGFYADKKDYGPVHADALGNYTIRNKEVEHLGDFKAEHYSGEKLDSQYQRHPFSYTNYFFRDKWYANVRPNGSERFVDRYLIRAYDNYAVGTYITIYDTEKLKQDEIVDASIILFIE